MVLRIAISPEAGAKLKARATAAGVDVATYASRQLERLAFTAPNLAATSGDAAKAFSDSGMTEEELGEFLETEKHMMRHERVFAR